MQLSVSLHSGGTEVIEIADKVFGCNFNEALVHQVVTGYLAGARQGTRAQKTRGEVRGGGKKPWRQKGSGRARAGSIRSPLWRGGGVTFAAKPQDYTQKINKKMYRGALRSILSQLIQSERLIVTDEFQISEPKTKHLVMQLQNWNIKQALIISHEISNALYLASRNLPHTAVCLVKHLNIVDLIRYPKTIMTLPAFKKLEEQLI